MRPNAQRMGDVQLVLRYDPEGNAASIMLGRGAPGPLGTGRYTTTHALVASDGSDWPPGYLNVDVDAEGRILAFEIIGARSMLPPDALDAGA